MRIHHILSIIISTLFAAVSCTTDVAQQPEAVGHPFTLTTDVLPFRGETATVGTPGGSRSTIDGTGFADGDWIRLKIICPFVTSSEYGESTWSGSYDAFFLLKRSGGSWVYLDASDHCDINGTYSYSGSPQVGSFYEAQQTPYVYMASTWSEEKNFKTSSGTHVLQYCHVFHADQRKEQHYKASDLLWAQQYMQTGAWNVHLNFEHKMACLTFALDDAALDEPLSDAVVLTLEGMPDIDQQEVIVGDYYAEKSKINSAGNFNYKNKHSCRYAYNGQVIGIGVNVDAANRSYAYPMTGNPNPAYNRTFTGSEIVPNTGTYTAYKVDRTHYRLIVPPCSLTAPATIWIRDGERRFTMPLTTTTFTEGTLYPVTVKL